MHSNFHRHIKLFGKIRFLLQLLINHILLPPFKIKNDKRSYEDRREYTYAEHIPERRSGTDRRKSKNGKSAFWPSTSPEHKNSKV